MRRLMAIAAFALLFAVPLWAQHGGGGHGGGGGHAGFGGGHAGFGGGHAGFSGGHFGGAVHSFSGARSAPGFSRSFSSSTRFGSARPGFSRGPFLHDGFRGHNGFGFRGRNRFGFHDRFGRGFHDDCRFFGCLGLGYYDPFLWDWWDSDSSYDQDYENNLALANELNEQSLEQQRLWQQEQAVGDQDAFAPNSSRPAPAAQSPAADPPSTIVPPTVLVFRDQHQQEVQNYAIVGQTLWNFGAQRTQKIPLADLDLAATEKANDSRGVTFRLPIGSEGQ